MIFSIRHALPVLSHATRRAATSTTRPRSIPCPRVTLQSHFATHRELHWSPIRHDDARSSSSSSSSSFDPPKKSAPVTTPSPELTFEPPEPRLSLTFTCTVSECSTRSTHEFTRRSYERGIVLVECPGCKNRHLIADHLGWFKESTEDGKLRTVEDLVRAKGEKVRRGRVDAGGVVEYAPE